MKLAPIVIFTYRREISQVIESLKIDPLSKKTDLIIYSDGHKNNNDFDDVANVRQQLRTISGFKSIKIIESVTNKGLAKSIISGVTETINEYEKIIVIEDDLIVSSDFINFMNNGLDFYQNSENIWSISGYSPSMKCLNNYNDELYLSVRASSWGWATWKNRWDTLDWEIQDWDTFKMDQKSIKQFEQGGNDMFKMLELQILGKIDSWAIRWCYNQFKQSMYTVYPTQSKIQNIGFDDNIGTHNATSNNKWLVSINNKPIKFHELKVDNAILSCFQQYHNITLFTKIGYLLKKHGAYRFAKKILKVVR